MDPLQARFLAGEAPAVARVEALVARVVGFRGYYIPAGERGDVVQDVMLRVWGTVREAGFSVNTNLEALVRAIAYRGCVDWMRRHRPSEPIDPAATDPAPQPDEKYLLKEREDLGRQVMVELRQPCRDLLRLHAGEGMSYRRIAELHGRSVGALRTQMWECLKEARGILGRIRDGRRAGRGRRRSDR